jgi:hypothetical protein
VWLSVTDCNVHSDLVWVGAPEGLWRLDARADEISDEQIWAVVDTPPILTAEPEETQVREQLDDDVSLTRVTTRFSSLEGRWQPVSGCEVCEGGDWCSMVIWYSDRGMSRVSRTSCFSPEHGLVASYDLDEELFYGEWVLKKMERTQSGPVEERSVEFDATPWLLMGEVPEANDVLERESPEQ